MIAGYTEFRTIMNRGKNATPVLDVKSTRGINVDMTEPSVQVSVIMTDAIIDFALSVVIMYDNRRLAQLV